MIKQRKGFTLIEMLVVILIIVVLMGMITGGLFSARERARKIRAETQLRELVNAWAQYYLYNENASGYPGDTWTEMTEKALKPLIEPVNGFVYLNISLKDAQGTLKYLDPWGEPYYIKFKDSPPKTLDPVFIRASVTFLNRNRE